MRKLFLLTAILFSINIWAQKEYTISNKNPSAWAPLSDGEVNVHTSFTNNATNPNDTNFYLEFLDATVPSAWGIGLCTNVTCFYVSGGYLNEKFPVSKGQTIDLKCIQAFSAVSGKGYARFLIYRAGLKSLADTVTYNANAPATGIKTASTKASEVSISPNPVKNDLIITMADMNINSVSIINVVGKEVMTIDFKNGKSFDVSTLPNGIYFLNIKKGETSISKKFVISR